MLAQAEIEKQLILWYSRFAHNNNEITLADAKRLLTGGELAEFRWAVGEYIAYGQQNALDGAWMKQLENASARVHISRLEAIKLQIQQQAERLYANQLDFVDAAARDLYLGSYYGTAFELQRGLGVGWTMQAIDDAAITKVLSRPWTADNLTFRDRCWTNKQALVNSVNTQLTQMIIRGESPDKAIAAISHQFKVSRDKAGRLIMTEAAAFSSAAQKDCYGELGVERFKVVATFDHDVCEICGALDGQVFEMADYQIGLTAPPFHPWCRCCTCPCFADMEKLGERWTRNQDGTTKKVPADMSFEEWKQKFVLPAPSGLKSGMEGGTINLWDEWSKISGQHTADTDAKATNPFRLSGIEYRLNCQRCVPAYEMRRRGYDVTAKPCVLPFPSADSFASQHWTDAFRNAKWVLCASSDELGEVTEYLRTWGDGARAEIYVVWKEAGGSHVFVGENFGGVVRFFDPQTGGVDIDYFQDAVPGQTWVCRIDNLVPSDYITECCEVIRCD